MAGQRFKMGDRVQLNAPYLDLPAGAQGTIVHIYLISDSYSVRFDTTSQRQTVDQRYLEPADGRSNKP
jgi:hypothetical protein